jgi:REP element-mobilizing transposase RayT
MSFDPDKHHRRSIRLPGYDYVGPGAYFVTICTDHRRHLFGQVVTGEMRLSALGAIVREEWLRTPSIRPGIEVDALAVMPNHVHGIIVLPGGPVTAEVGAHSCAPLRRPRRSLSSFVAQFKATAARRINARRGTPGARVWQRNYYEHVIRSDATWTAICVYIEANPALWPYDRDNLHGTKPRRADLRQAFSAHGLSGSALDFIINYDIRYRTEREGGGG